MSGNGLTSLRSPWLCTENDARYTYAVYPVRHLRLICKPNRGSCLNVYSPTSRRYLLYVSRLICFFSSESPRLFNRRRHAGAAVTVSNDAEEFQFDPEFTSGSIPDIRNYGNRQKEY
jgi:hypothetical protein